MQGLCRIIIVLFILPVAAAAQPYQITLLPTLGRPQSYARGINEAGQVVGKIVDEAGVSRAVVWEEGEARLLPLLPGGTYSSAFRISDRGEVVGLAETLVGGQAREHAVYWGPDGAIDIGTLGGARSFAQDINDLGTVVGSADAEMGSRAFTWTLEGGIIDYGNLTPGFRLANAGFNGINNSGRLVGTAFTFLEPFRAIAGQEGEKDLVDISRPGRTNSMALAVNEAGVIVGFASQQNGPARAAIFDGRGDFADLGALDLSDSQANDINNFGVIVGFAEGPDEQGLYDQKAFVYRDGEMVELMTLIPEGSGWGKLISADAINDRGWIAGTGVYEGRLRAFVMTPVPEPGCSGVLASMVILLRRRRSNDRGACAPLTVMEGP